MRNFARMMLAVAVAVAAFGGFADVDPREAAWPTPNQPAVPAAPVNILSIGNSFASYVTASDCNLADLAQKLGYNINHYCTFGPGLTVSQHWLNRSTVGFYSSINAKINDTAHRPVPQGSTAENVSLMYLLTNGTWDVVTVQFASDDGAHNRNLGKTGYESSWNNFTNLVNLIHETQPNAKIVLQQTWGWGRAFSGNCEGGTPSIEKHDNHYESTATTYNQAYHESPQPIYNIIPTGYAVQKFLYALPALTVEQENILYNSDDHKHLNLACGTALQAMVWCKALFGDVPAADNLPASLVTKCGSGSEYFALMRQCAIDACAPGISYYDYGRGTVDFSYQVEFRNYAGVTVSAQTVTNLACAVAPDIATVDVGGSDYEATGWKDRPSGTLMSSADVNATRVFGPVTYTIQRKLVGEAGPTRVWTGLAGNNSWANSQNWDPAAVPDENSDIYIPLAAEAGSNTLVKVSSSVTVNSITIGSGDGLGTAELMLAGSNKTTRVKGNLLVKNRGVLSSESNGYTTNNGTSRKMRSYNGAYRVYLEADGDITIDAGGKVDVTGCGYVYEKGFNTGFSSDDTYTLNSTYMSGAHAGNAAGNAHSSTQATPSTKPTYGSIRRPITVGSGGSRENHNAYGGGAIHLICTNGTLTINGDILACGRKGTSNNAVSQTGAGGSIWLEAGAFYGTGSIDVRGGAHDDGRNNYGCGGSGRVAIYTGESNTDVFRDEYIRIYAGPREANTAGTPNKNCHGGGTVYFEHAGHVPGCGDLLIDGNDVATYNSDYGTVISRYVDEGHDDNAIFESITIRNQGRLIVNEGQRLRTYELNVGMIGSKGSYTESGIEIVSRHTWGEWRTELEPTCTNQGFRVRTCTCEECDPKVSETNTIDALGHDWGEWTTNAVPQVGVAGDREHTCRRTGCGITEHEEIPALEPPTPPPGPTPHELPDYLVAEDYIQSSAAQYIDTSIGRQDKLLVDFDLEWTKVNANQYMMGSYTGSNDKQYVLNLSASAQWRGGVNANGLNAFTLAAATANTRYSVQSHFNGTTHTMTVNGTSESFTGTTQAAVPSKHFYLFGYQAGTSYAASARLYSCKIYTNATTAANGVLARDYVPAYNMTTSKHGLYDFVTETFYPSASATAFTGPYSPEPPPVHEHVYGDWVTNQLANCTDDGVRVRTCTAEGCSVPPYAETNVFENAWGHQWGAWTTNAVPDIGVAGDREHTCQREGCGVTVHEVLPAIVPEPNGPNLIENPNFELKEGVTDTSKYYSTYPSLSDKFNSDNVYVRYLVDNHWYGYRMDSNTIGGEYKPGWVKGTTHTADGTGSAHYQKTCALLADFTVPVGRGGTYQLDFWAKSGSSSYSTRGKAPWVTAYIVPRATMATTKFSATSKATIFPYIVPLEHFSTHEMTNSVMLTGSSWQNLTGTVELEPGDYTIAFCNAQHCTSGDFYVTVYTGVYLDEVSLQLVGDPTHVHVWGDWTTNSVPTQTADGERTRICEWPGCTDPVASETQVLPRTTGDIRITELMAKNSTVVSACRKKECDWIEIRNFSDHAVGLGRWGVTDSKKNHYKAVIPDGFSIGAGETIVIYCGDETYVCASNELHVALGLSTKKDEFIGLYNCEDELVTSITYPEQYENVSYGLGYRDPANPAGDPEPLYFREPTPGEANTVRGYIAKTKKVRFSEPHGYRTESFELTLSCEKDPTAAIYYTVNGKSPTTSDNLYTGPITITNTTCIRAAAVNADSILQQDTSATYLFADDILAQPAYRNVSGDLDKWNGQHAYDLYKDLGFPRSGAVNSHVMHYGFNQTTVAAERERMLAGLTNDIDTISLVIDRDCLFKSSEPKGIYSFAYMDGAEAERTTMVECICPTNSANEFTVQAGLRIRGGSSRQSDHPKHSFRLFFRDQYGDGKLDFPLFGDEGLSAYRKIDLRTSQNWSISNDRSRHDTFIHETFLRDTQRDLGQPYTRSRYYHLFINGIYWGLYQTQERVDEDYGEAYLGGSADDYDVIKRSMEYDANGDILGSRWNIAAGSTNAYNRLCALAKEGFGGEHTNNYFRGMGLNPDGTRNPDYPVLFNPENLMAFILINHYTCNVDSPVNSGTGNTVDLNNLYAIRNRVDDETGNGYSGFCFFCHDGEHSFGTDTTYDVDGTGADGFRCVRGHYSTDRTLYSTHERSARFANPIWSTMGRDSEGGSVGYFGPAELHYQLLQHPDYRMKYADYIYRVCLKEGGELTIPESKKRFRKRMDEIDNAISAEYARWDWNSVKPNHDTWTNACQECFTFIDNRLDYMIPQYRAAGFYPSIDAPTAAVSEGAITVTDADDDVTLYYTLDGADPRLDGGGLNPAALVYSAALPVGDDGARFRVRARTAGGEWSALEFLDLAPIVPRDDTITGEYPDGTNIVLETAAVIKLGDTVFGGPLTISGADAVLELLEGRTAVIPAITASNALTIDGTGTLAMTGTTTIVDVAGDFIVTNGVIDICYRGDVAASCAVNLGGNFYQYGGEVDLTLESDVQIHGFYCNVKNKVAEMYDGTFKAVIDAGEKSAAFKLNKGSNDARFKGGSVKIKLGGIAPRFVNTDGKLTLNGAAFKVSTMDGLAETARVFKCVKKLSIKSGVITGEATGAGSEIFSSDDTIEVEGGVVSVTADDDCFSAENEIDISGGMVQALSNAGDAIDSNGSIAISGGYVFATTLSGEHEGLDVDPAGADALEHKLFITGGHVVAVGGRNVVHPPDAGSVACYVNADITSLKKYLVLTSSANGTNTLLSVKLDGKRNPDGFSLIAYVPNMTGAYTDTKTKPTEADPAGVKLDQDLDGVFVTVYEAAPPAPPTDWPDDPASVTGQTAGAAFGLTGGLADVDAVKLAMWAKGVGSVSFANREEILLDAYLLNCANTLTAINLAKAAFRFTEITAGTVPEPSALGTPNGTVEVQGSDTLAPPDWTTPATGSHRFYRALLRK